MPDNLPADPIDLGLSAETIAFIALKAKAYDAQVDPVDPEEASNPLDDGFVDSLEDTKDNPTARELRAAINSLDVESQAALVALTWIGREDFEPEDWEEARAAARERAVGPTARYLMGIPLLGDYLEEGASRLGVPLTTEELAGMHHPQYEEPASREDRT